MEKFKVKVIFRKFKNGEIIALFPEIVGRRYVSSYMHLGQHSDADYSHVVQGTTLATPDEYMELKKELEKIGYIVVVGKKAKIKYKV